MKKNTATTKTALAQAFFQVRVVYGFLQKLQIVLLGEILEGTIETGMKVQVQLSDHTCVGEWTVSEILHMDFINQAENPDFIGVVVQCRDLEGFKLLQSLRVYEEVIRLQVQ